MAKKPRKHPIRLKHNQPDISGWDLDALDEIRDAIEPIITKVANEAIRFAMEAENTGVSWASKWTDEQGFGDGFTAGDAPGADPIDPLDLYVEIGLGDTPDSNPQYAFNLRDILSDTLSECRDDGSYSEGLTRIKDALRALADEIEDALPKE